MSATSSSGLLARVQAQLAGGQDDAEVVRDLVAGGLSQASAERFVQRARASGPPPTERVAPAAPIDRSDAAPDPMSAAPQPSSGAPTAFSDRATFIAGAALLTLGIGLLWWAMLEPSPVRMKPILGLIVTGGLTFLHAARRLGDGRAPTPWRFAALVTAPVAFVALGVFDAWVQTANPRPPALDPQKVAARQTAAEAVMRTKQDQAMASAVRKLKSDRPMERCGGAGALRLMARPDAVPPLLDAFSAATDDYTKACTAAALVTRGEQEAMLPHYLEWIRHGSNDLRRAAISGIGQIGPAAAADAIAVLQDTLTTSPYSDHRALAAITLAELGPAARPALELAARDEDEHVRRTARVVLSTLP